MHSLKVILPLFGLLALGAVAKADTFNFSSVTLTENKGSTKIYGTVTGSVSIDPTTGVVQSTGDDFVATYGATDTDGSNPTASYTFTDLTNADSVPVADGYIDAVFTASDGTKFDLEFTDVSGVITLCSTTNGLCNQPGPVDEQTHLDTSPNEDLIVGSLVASNATPEPSSLLLLGTGLLGFAGTIRRKR